MYHFDFIVEPYLSGTRIDTFLSRHLRNYTTWRLHRMVCAGLVTVNHLVAESDQRVYRGQTVHIQLADPPDKLLAPRASAISIVYEDPWLLVVDKPAGMVCHPVGEWDGDTLCNVLQEYFDQKTTARGLVRPGIVHRLDRMTSGLLVVPRDHMAHRKLSVDFQRGRTAKQYMALVEGSPAFEERVIELPIGRRPGTNSVLMCVGSHAINPRPSRTDVRVVKRLESSTIVDCTLHTGRNHQIRVHLAAIGFPVCSDEYYGPYGQIRKSARASDEPPSAVRHALHASALGFEHPVLRQKMTFRSIPPSDFWDLAD